MSDKRSSSPGRRAIDLELQQMSKKAMDTANAAYEAVSNHLEECARNYRELKDDVRDLPVIRDRQNLMFGAGKWALALLIVTMVSTIGTLLMLLLNKGP